MNSPFGSIHVAFFNTIAAFLLVPPTLASTSDSFSQCRDYSVRLEDPASRPIGTRALAELRKSAEAGSVRAQVRLGVLYRDGDRVSQNDRESVRWFRMAASRGSTFAQFALAYMYERGRGTERNYIESYKWYELSSRSHLQWGGKERLRVIRSKMTTDQVASAEAQVSAWLESHPRIHWDPELKEPEKSCINIESSAEQK